MLDSGASRPLPELKRPKKGSGVRMLGATGRAERSLSAILSAICLWPRRWSAAEARRRERLVRKRQMTAREARALD